MYQSKAIMKHIRRRNFTMETWVEKLPHIAWTLPCSSVNAPENVLPKSEIQRRVRHQKCIKLNIWTNKIYFNNRVNLPVSSSMTSMLVALYRGQSAEPIFNAAHGLVTMDFLDVACRLLLNPTRYTESPRHNAGSVSKSIRMKILLEYAYIR